MRTFKKKLTLTPPATLIKALLLLETCVKNCGHRFHLVLSERSFMESMAKLVHGKVHTPCGVRVRSGVQYRLLYSVCCRGRGTFDTPFRPTVLRGGSALEWLGHPLTHIFRLVFLPHTHVL